jgi:hypothetical protein
MGSNYKKIKYESEGPHGSTEENWLYIGSSRSTDIVTVYSNEGAYLFSFSETGFDMGMALKTAFTDWNDERMVDVSYSELKEIGMVK